MSIRNGAYFSLATAGAFDGEVGHLSTKMAPVLSFLFDALPPVGRGAFGLGGRPWGREYLEPGPDLEPLDGRLCPRE